MPANTRHDPYNFPTMKPEYIHLNGCVVTLAQIIYMRPTRTDEDGDFAVALSGTRILYVDKSEGEPLWAWLNKQAVEPNALSAF